MLSDEVVAAPQLFLQTFPASAVGRKRWCNFPADSHNGCTPTQGIPLVVATLLEWRNVLSRIESADGPRLRDLRL